MPLRKVPHSLVPIQSIECEAYAFPFQKAESDGTETWDKTTLILTRIQAGGETGLGYTYGDPPTAQIVRSILAPAVMGQSAFDIQKLWFAMLERVRNTGRPGIASMAIASVDTALWDLKAKLLKQPLSVLLGQVRPAVAAYGSGGFTSLSKSELENQLDSWLELGITRVKIKIGREPEKDPERVRIARETIGPDTELYVDANGAYDCKQALTMAETLAIHDVRWFEEPVSSDDLNGLHSIRNRAPVAIEIAAGEYGYDPEYYVRMLDAQAVDVAQIDATRCLGITGFLKAAAICETHFIPISAHTAPSLHIHLGCALPHMRHVEYFSDHAWVESQAFEGAIQARNGLLAPDLSCAGLGLELKLQDIQSKRVA